MRVKRMTIKEGERYGISRFPNFHRTGSVRGMSNHLKTTDMNTDIYFMNIAEGDKEFVSTFENFVNGKVE